MAGVSPATVSNTFNNRRYVGSLTKQRIKEAAVRLGYTPNVHARRMRTTGIGTIGILSSMPFAISGDVSRLGFLMEIAATAAVTSLKRGFALLLVPSIAEEPTRLDNLAIDAALVVEPSSDDPYVAQLRALGVPMVTIGKVPDATGIASVDLRSAQTARMLFTHLRDHGARQIALITGVTRRNSSVEAEAAYAAFARAHRMKAVTLQIDESGGELAAYAATLQLMRDYPDIDGILASVDTFATGVMHALAELDIAVPEKVLVATRYDGNRARDSRPPLTAVNLHLGDIATMAIALLLDQIDSGPHERTVLAPVPTIVTRESSGGTRHSEHPTRPIR